MATIQGTPGNDILLGTPNDDRIEGYSVARDGADRVDLLGGSDSVFVNGPTFISLDPRVVGDGFATDQGGRSYQDGGLAVRYQAANTGRGGIGPVARFDDEGITFATSQVDVSSAITVADLSTGTIIASGIHRLELGSSGDDSLFAGNSFTPPAPGRGGVAIGGAGNDQIRSQGPAVILGGTGTDTFIVSATATEPGVDFRIDAGRHVVVDDHHFIRFNTVATLGGIERLQFSDRTVANDDGQPLVDDIFYFATNADIRQGSVEADAHYAEYGRLEGRDPNAFFSTTGYLAANADVRTSGADPLAHYDGFGWKEGRDPSAFFDNELYLKNNPDVARAGVDPLSHFLQFGQDEGRAAYAAVGTPSSFTRGSFDFQFYLLANPDVARAAIAAGGDPGAFASSHFDTFGWREGRDPNHVFDVPGYLRAYADVAAAGIDPLAHYDTFGWKEGRDPSASFDTRSYRAQNPDVAGINPLQHYLQFGELEGRAPYGDGFFA